MKILTFLSLFFLAFNSSASYKWPDNLLGSYSTQGQFENKDCQIDIVSIKDSGFSIWKKIKSLNVKTPHFNNGKEIKVNCVYKEVIAGCFVDLGSRALVLHNPYIGYDGSIWSYVILKDEKEIFECKSLKKN